MKKLTLLALTLFLAACGTTTTLTGADLAKTIPAGQARIVVKREPAFSYAGNGALVAVNDKTLGTLGQGGEGFLDVKAGPVSVTVRATSAMGSPYGLSVASINAKAGKTYRFIVLPNSSRAWTSLAFGTLADEAAHSGTGYFQVNLKGDEQ